MKFFYTILSWAAVFCLTLKPNLHVCAHCLYLRRKVSPPGWRQHPCVRGANCGTVSAGEQSRSNGPRLNSSRARQVRRTVCYRDWKLIYFHWNGLPGHSAQHHGTNKCRCVEEDNSSMFSYVYLENKKTLYLSWMLQSCFNVQQKTLFRPKIFSCVTLHTKLNYFVVIYPYCWNKFPSK